MLRIYLGFAILLLQFHVPLTDDVTKEVPPDAYFKKEWEKHEFPNPLTKDGSWDCGNRGKKYYLCDPSRELDQAETFEISSLIRRWLSIARCPCLNCGEKGPYFIIMVAIVPKLKEQPDMDNLAATVQFAEYLRTEAWNFAQCEDSIIIVLSVEDKSLWTAVGKKATESLTKACIGDIFEENKNLFQSGIYGKAIENLVAEYVSILKEDRDCNFEWPSWWKYPAIVVATIIIVVFIGDQVSGYLFHQRIFACMYEFFRKGTVSRVNPLHTLARQQQIQQQEVESNTSVHSIFSLTNPPSVHNIHSLSENKSTSSEEEETEITESSSTIGPFPFNPRDPDRFIYFTTDGKTGHFQIEYSDSDAVDLDTDTSSHISIHHRRY